MSENYDKIIRLAWHDKTSFDEIKRKLHVNEDDVIKIMRANLKSASFKLWRKRVSGRRSKHQKKSEIISKFEKLKIKNYEVN
jgi:uncharacterized protein (TIGR03643 family)